MRQTFYATGPTDIAAPPLVLVFSGPLVLLVIYVVLWVISDD